MYSLIKKVVCCPGVSGNEKQIAALLEKEVAPFVDETYTDALGNLIAIKYGPKIGLGTAFVYSLTQLLQAHVEGDVFPYCETGATLVICILFDYIFPFTVLGLAGVFKNVRLFKKKVVGAYVGMVAVVIVRFFSHFITGVAIWGQWAPDGMGKYLYSFGYNASFLSVDLAICLICAVPMLCSKAVRRLVNVE